MGTGYIKTSPTNFVEGETINASDFTTEFDGIDAAFETGGHQHDGTDGEGGAIEKLLSNTITLGTGADTDISVTFNANTTDGVLTWMEDEDYFLFSDDLLLATTEKLQFRDTAIYINSSTDGQLDLVADTEIQIAATTVDINGAVDISGTLTQGGASQFNSTITVGADDTGYDVKLFGATSGAYLLWDESADDLKLVGAAGLTVAGDIDVDGTTNLDAVDIDGAVQVDNTVTVGVDDTGYDVKFFGATSGAYLLWDESADDLKLVGAAGLTVAGDIDVDGTTNLDAVDIDGAVQLDSTLTVGVDDTGYDVKFFGATSGAYMLWDESADDLKLVGAAGLTVAGDIDVDGTTNLDAVDIDGAVQLDSTLTVGVNDTGYDVKLFGATSGSYLLWDESADDLKLVGAAGLTVAGDVDVDGTTNLDAVDIDGATQIDGTVTVGVDDTGYDVKFFGATSGAYMLWDESADDLKLVGAAGLTVAGDIDVDGTTNLDAVDIDGNTQMDGTLTVGADDTGYDVKFHGATSGDYLLWDESADTLILHGDMQTATAGTSNFVLGVNAGNSIASGGNYNVAIGDEAGTALTTGDNNVAVGYAALDANTTASYNTAVGVNALGANTTGASNTAVGYSSLVSNTTGTRNHAIGHGALQSNTTGNYNTAVGYLTLQLNTTASSNAAFGDTALYNCTTGANNTALGYFAGYSSTTAAQNVMIGHSAGQNLTTGTYNIYIGYNNNPSAVGVSGEIVIAHANQVGKGTNTGFINPNGGGVYQGNNSTAWSQTSDRRIKKDIVPNTKGLAAINQIEPMNFYYKSDEELQEELPGAKEGLPLNKLTTSAIAQELELIFPEAIERRGEHDIMSVNTDPIFWSMVNAIKELSAKVTELEDKLNG